MGRKEAKVERRADAAAATHVGAASHFTPPPRETASCVFPTDRPTSHIFFLFRFSVCSSASEDLGCRRGDFSRKHYGSVELVSPRPFPPSSLRCRLPSAGVNREGRGREEEEVMVGWG